MDTLSARFLMHVSAQAAKAPTLSDKVSGLNGVLL